MSNLSVTTQVGEFVTQMPGRYRIFQDHGIDFCCGGKMPLEQACHEKGLNPSSVLGELLAYRMTTDDTVSLQERSLTEICDLIERTHHAYVRDALPRLATLAQKVAHAHAANHPEMREAHTIVLALAEEMQSHMLKEERVLFPAIRQIEAGDGHAAGHCGSVANPIRVMEMEHESAGGALVRLRELTHNFTAPADACNTFRALLAGIQDFESDLHQHVHKENNILFPRAIAMEQNLRGA